MVSNRRLAGQRLGDLDLDLAGRFGVTATRVRRGDDDLVATDDFVLQLGDRVRVVGPDEQLGQVARVLGDAERRLAEVDAFGFAVGIAAGLAVGAVSVPLPGDVDGELGAGGGTLVVGLVLGVVSRIGPITWQIPHGAPPADYAVWIVAVGGALISIGLRAVRARESGPNGTSGPGRRRPPAVR